MILYLSTECLICLRLGLYCLQQGKKQTGDIAGRPKSEIGGV